MSHDRWPLLVSLVSLALAVGCGGLAEDDDDDDDASQSYELSVQFGASEETVDLFDLDTEDWNGAPAVSLPDVLDAAGVGDPSAYTYGFTAYDDYMKDGVTWDKAEVAVLIQESGDLEFPDEAEMESAYFVKGVVDIALTEL